MRGPGTYLWSADGNYGITADGFRGWSADGYEPINLSVAEKLLATNGVKVSSIIFVSGTTSSFTFGQSGFGQAPFGTVSNALVPPGYVITGLGPYLQSPPIANSVILLVSGYAPRTANMVYVPDVVGMFYSDAQLAILDAGMLILPPVLTISSLVLPQYVISQSIPEGTLVAQQTQMGITVSAFTVVQQPGIPTPVL